MSQSSSRCSHQCPAADGSGGRHSVTASVILDGARIGTGATVSHSVVMGCVGAGALVANCVLGADAVVADGESRADERIA